MNYSLKANEKEARERLKAFWAGESIGRPALYIIADNPDFKEEPWDKVHMDRKERDLCPEWHIWCNKKHLNSTVFLAEAMPSALINYGNHLATTSVLAGGKYIYNDSRAWIKSIDNLWDRPLPVFYKEHPFVKAMEQCYLQLAKVIGERAYINPPVLLDSLTVLSLFRTTEEFCMDLMENPDVVKQWNAALTSLNIDCYKHFYSFIKDLGYGDTSSWLHVTAEGRFEVAQCDFGVMISPAMFEEFALPELYRFTEALDYSLYHLDGTCQMRFIDLLKTLPKLNGIQWNPQIFEEPQIKWIDAFKEIRKRKFCLYTHCHSVEDAVAITRELGPDGLMLVLPRFKSLDEAEKAIREIEKVC